MLRKILGILLVIGVSLFALQQIRLSLRSPGERLRLRVSEMVRDYNRGRVGDVSAGFHPDFRDESSGATKSDVHGALASLWGGNRESGTGKYLLEFQWITPFEPDYDEESASAKADVEFQIVDKRHSPPRVWWKTSAHLQFRYENGAWRVYRTGQVDHANRGQKEAR